MMVLQTTGLQSFADNVWIAQQPLRFLGLRVGTRMTIVRLDDGRLIVISPVQLNPELIQQIDAIGTVAYMIAPNRYHHLFAQGFQQQYPQAEFWAAIGLAEKRPDLPIKQVMTEESGNITETFFYQQFCGVNVPGVGAVDPLNEVVFFHAPSRTLIITDIAFHFDAGMAWETRLAGKLIRSYDQLKPSLLEKWAMRDRAAVEKSIRSVLNWDFDRVIMAHGKLIETNGKAMLKSGYEDFLGISLT
jgi:hypothetical protein